MNWAFLTQPPSDDAQNAYVVAAHSKEFAIDNARRAEDEMKRAQQRLGDAIEKHGGSDAWDDERVVSRAEDNFESTEASRVHAVNKRRWEMNDGWKQTFPRTAASIARTKALLLTINWPSIRPKL